MRYLIYLPICLLYIISERDRCFIVFFRKDKYTKQDVKSYAATYKAGFNDALSLNVERL